jgi:hypothetical protein
MLPFLYAAQRDGWYHLVTGHESWFSSLHHPVECGRYREIMWSQNWDSKFKAQSRCFRLSGIRAAAMLVADSQIIRKWTTHILWQRYLFYSRKRFFLKEGRLVKDDLWFILVITQFSEIAFEQICLKNTILSACYSHPIHLIWPLVTSACF